MSCYEDLRGSAGKAARTLKPYTEREKAYFHILV